jgi:hypothetical protein
MIRLSKILTVEVIILLIGISVVSSANDLDINNDEVLIENPDVEQSDNQIEIISYITGHAFDVDKTGFIFNEPIDITAWKMSINILGIKIPSIHSFNMLFYISAVSSVKASRFFGRVNENDMPPSVNGFAIGNVEWN